MEDNVTGEGTRILTRRLEEHEVVSFVVREVPENQRFEQRYFKDPTGAYYNQVLHRLQEHLDRLRAEKLENRPPVVNQQKPIEEVNTKYRNKVNEKRQKIAALIEGSVSPKLTHIANRLHCSFELVKKVYNEMRVLGEVQRFQYQNMHTEEEEADLADALEGCHISYTTVTDIKRANPTYSRKKILERLHQRRLKWTELRGVPNIKKKRTMRDPPNPRKMRHIVRTITCALQDPTTEVFYVDEMKFPLHQTPRHHWADPNLPDQLAWGQRLSRTTLTAIAICSIRRFEAVQLYKEEVNGRAFKYFIEAFVSSLPLNKQYLIVLDNASWHKGGAMTNLRVQKFFLYNEPQQYQLNMIENCFSYIRALFRKRPLVHTIEEEAKQIVNLFFDRDIEEKFTSFFRNHIRSLLFTGRRNQPPRDRVQVAEQEMQE